MKKYILYTRTGSVRQSRKGISIEYQKAYLKEYARRNNLQIGEVIKEVGSGASEKRKGIIKVLKLLTDGIYQGILCTDFSKISRCFSLTNKFWQLIAEKGVEIITPSQIYKNNSDSRIKMFLQTNVDEIYRKNMSESIRRGLQAKKERRHR